MNFIYLSMSSSENLISDSGFDIANAAADGFLLLL